MIIKLRYEIGSRVWGLAWTPCGKGNRWSVTKPLKIKSILVSPLGITYQFEDQNFSRPERDLFSVRSEAKATAKAWNDFDNRIEK